MQLRIANQDDIEAILQLQESNLLTNIDKTKIAAGFVTTPFTTNQIIEIIAEGGLFIAIDNNKLVGYVFAGSWEYFSKWPIFPFMVNRLSDLVFAEIKLTDKNTFQYGPVCVDFHYRGTGLFENLFDFMKKNMQEKYPIGVTFINKLNKRSFGAHTQKANLVVIDEFDFTQSAYYTLAFKTTIES